MRCEADVASASLRVERPQAGRDELAEAGVAQLEREHARVDPRELEEILHEEREGLELLSDRGQILVRRGEPVLERLDHRAERSERRPEVVAGPGDELPASVEEPLDARRHLVEGSAELEELARAGLGRAGSELAAGEPGGGRPQPLQGTEDPAREEQRADQRRERRGDGDGEDLRVVVHAEHHPARGEHDAERQADGEQRERDDLEPQGGEQPDGRRDGDSRREDAEAEDERDEDHDRRR